MHKTRCVVELEGEEISLFFEVLDETLRLWNEKGFESEEEKAEYQRISSVASKLHEAMGETTKKTASQINKQQTVCVRVFNYF